MTHTLRNAAIRKSRKQGASCASLAATYGLTRQRIAQIVGSSEAVARAATHEFERLCDQIEFQREDIPEDERSHSTRLSDLYIKAEKAMARFQRAIRNEKTDPLSLRGLGLSLSDSL